MVIDFHFDFLSPYAYLAWTQIDRVAALSQEAPRRGATVNPVPTLLAALLAHGNTKGPAEIPAKRVYVFVDTLRSARHLGVPLSPPPAHPFNPLLALRACCMVEGDDRRRLVTALYAQTWGGERVGCDTRETVLRAARTAGIDAGVVDAAESDLAKRALKDATERAIARGVFGVPTMITGPGPSCFFFGLDSLPALERHLDGREAVADEDLAVWRDLPASASRR